MVRDPHEKGLHMREGSTWVRKTLNDLPPIDSDQQSSVQQVVTKLKTAVTEQGLEDLHYALGADAEDDVHQFLLQTTNELTQQANAAKKMLEINSKFEGKQLKDFDEDFWAERAEEIVMHIMANALANIDSRVPVGVAERILHARKKLEEDIVNVFRSHRDQRFFDQEVQEAIAALTENPPKRLKKDD